MSCLAQTYSNFELIVTDNSTDSQSGQMLEKIGDPRIRYFKNEGNIGAHGSSSRAAMIAQGKYIKFLMDDDLLRPQCLELMVGAFEKYPKVGIAMAPMELIDKDDRRIFPKFYFVRTMDYRYRYQVGDGLIDRKRLLKDFLTRDYPCTVPSGIMYRAELIREMLPFDPALDFAGDLDVCMRIAASNDFFYIDQVLSAWRFVPASETATMHRSGSKIEVFYEITRRCLARDPVKKMFAGEWAKLVRDSYLFCDFRSLMLNGMAAVRARSPRLLFQTISHVFREDKHWTNLFRVPIFAMKEVFVSVFPRKLPPARE